MCFLNDCPCKFPEVFKFLQSAEQTSLTNESVASISAVTDLITAINSQTNLLSLNAGTEAARVASTDAAFP